MASILKSSLQHLNRTAIVTESSFKYRDLVAASLDLHYHLQSYLPTATSKQNRSSNTPPPRFAIMCGAGPEYITSTFATWLHKGIAVPLCLDHPDRDLDYVLENSGAEVVLSLPQHAARMHALVEKNRGGAARVVEVPPMENTTAVSPNSSEVDCSSISDKDLQDQVLDLLGRGFDTPSGLGLVNSLETDKSSTRTSNATMTRHPALMVYTSGTTGRPKGALHTHHSIHSMVNTLVNAWEWRETDRILHALPLHHVHGIVNALYCALEVGAAVEVLPKFSPSEAWRRIMRKQDPITVIMGVPTMYSFLLNHYHTQIPLHRQSTAAQAASTLRLTVSGSAACPIPILHQWKELTGAVPLERYGMTETGMILGNPLHGERRPGSVGVPFPGVDIKIVPSPEKDKELLHSKEEQLENSPGELCVKSDQLFSGYWGNKEATAEAFDAQGYFHTGDTAVWEGNPPYIRLLGRTSVDIIKRGGYKISALGIESVLLEHPAIKEVAVLGLPDPQYGEAIAAVVAVNHDTPPLTLPQLRDWASDLLPSYQLPTILKVVEGIPRNAMGKINKKVLKVELFGPSLATTKDGK